jgi:hypothetical protein
MKAGTILATLVATGAIAAGTITSTASAAARCDAPYIAADLKATKLAQEANKNGKANMTATAAALDLLAWRTELNAPIPCSPSMRKSRQYELKALADYYNADKAFFAGRDSEGAALTKAGLRATDQATAAWVATP